MILSWQLQDVEKEEKGVEKEGQVLKYHISFVSFANSSSITLLTAYRVR
jgi:hypothetical protein